MINVVYSWVSVDRMAAFGMVGEFFSVDLQILGRVRRNFNSFNSFNFKPTF